MKRLTLLLSVLAIALFAACGEQADEGTQAPADGTDEAAMVEVTITNGLELWDIYFILIDPSDETWGEDRLGADILTPGESFTVEIEEGTWDIMVEDEDGDTYTLWQVDIGPESYQWNVTIDDMDSGWGEDEFSEPQIIETGEGSTYIAITNDLQGWDIYWVYVEPTDAPFSDDLMGSDILFQDDQLIVWVDPGTYDIQVEDEDGDTYTLLEAEVDAAGFEWSVTLGDMDPMSGDEIYESVSLETGEGIAPVTIVNDLGAWDIHYVYVDPSDSPWGEDCLGADIILTGSSEITVWVDPGIYDMRVTDEDGDTYTLWEIDVDENGYEWEVTLSDMD
ncbi:MAG: hypothetical protein KAT09_03295 [Candidatus Aegiribacteria sp.]|nr:hypothetical protein [Candidatus Aegiribacteria sp.]